MGNVRRTAAAFFLLLAVASCAVIGIGRAQGEFDKGMALFNRGRYEEAAPHFEKATEHDPNFAQAYIYLGRSYLNLRRWSQAVPPLRTALRLSPEETRKEILNMLMDALLGGAVSEYSYGNFNTARAFLREAVGLDPENTKAQMLLKDLLEQ
ncbi:MAG TPA: tetratricopeptide repeat protein [Dissulfurispiraceae bacterium]